MKDLLPALLFGVVLGFTAAFGYAIFAIARLDHHGVEPDTIASFLGSAAGAVITIGGIVFWEQIKNRPSRTAHAIRIAQEARNARNLLQTIYAVVDPGMMAIAKYDFNRADFITKSPSDLNVLRTTINHLIDTHCAYVPRTATPARLLSEAIARLTVQISAASQLAKGGDVSILDRSLLHYPASEAVEAADLLIKTAEIYYN